VKRNKGKRGVQGRKRPEPRKRKGEKVISEKEEKKKKVRRYSKIGEKTALYLDRGEKWNR